MRRFNRYGVFVLVLTTSLLSTIACKGISGTTGPSETVKRVTVTPNSSMPGPGEERMFQFNLPGSTVTGLQITAALVMVRRDDGGRYLKGCTGNTGGIGIALTPGTSFYIWGKGHIVDAEVLVAHERPGNIGRCMFSPSGSLENVLRNLAEYIEPVPLGWQW